MFHLYTLQGKRIGSQLEHLHKNVRVHHTKKISKGRKFSIDDTPNPSGDENTNLNYGAEIYKKASKMKNVKSQVFHASEIMSSPVFTTTADVTAIEAWEEFKEKKVHHMPVVSAEGEIIGIISERDLLKKLIIIDGEIETSKNITVKDIMSIEVIATTPLTDIRRIAKAMLDNNVGVMPIVNDDDSIAGIITRSDILNAIIHKPELKLWA